MTAVDFRFNEYIQKINAEKEAEKREKIEKIEIMTRNLSALAKLKIGGLDKMIMIGAFLAIVTEIAALTWMSLFAIKQSMILYNTFALGLAFAVICQGLVAYNIFMLLFSGLTVWYGKKNVKEEQEKIKEEIRKLGGKNEKNSFFV